jgi:hypothetical protein
MAGIVWRLWQESSEIMAVYTCKREVRQDSLETVRMDMLLPDSKTNIVTNAEGRNPNNGSFYHGDPTYEKLKPLPGKGFKEFWL